MPDDLYDVWDDCSSPKECIRDVPWDEALDWMARRGGSRPPADLKSRVDSSPLAMVWAGFTIHQRVMT